MDLQLDEVFSLPISCRECVWLLPLAVTSVWASLARVFLSSGFLLPLASPAAPCPSRCRSCPSLDREVVVLPAGGHSPTWSCRAAPGRVDPQHWLLLSRGMPGVQNEERAHPGLCPWLERHPCKPCLLAPPSHTSLPGVVAFVVVNFCHVLLI